MYTVNIEYQDKITELAELKNYIENLLRVTEVGMVFLDKRKKIQKFTLEASKMLNVILPDIGRSFGDLTLKVEGLPLPPNHRSQRSSRPIWL